jgi:hypothetical protein
MSADTVPALDTEQTYELCPDCGGVRSRYDRLRRAWAWIRRERHGFCLTCMDEELVPHGCEYADVEV